MGLSALNSGLDATTAPLAVPCSTLGSWRDSAGWLARARRLGPLRYSDLGPRRLSPVSPPDVGPLAAWLADFADERWEEAGRADPFTLVVVSGDDGSLARAVLAIPPRCGSALRYVLVDPDRAADAGAAERGRSGPPPGLSRLVPLENPAFLYPAAPVATGEEGDGPMGAAPDRDERQPARGVGPLATFLTEVPSLGDDDGALVALDVLGHLPYDRFEWVDGRWLEIRVAAPSDLPDTSAQDAQDRMTEIAVPADDATLPPVRGPAGGRYLKRSGAALWLRRILPTAPGSILAVVDSWSGTSGGPEALDLDQLRQVREAMLPAPAPVAGTSLAVVTWRLG
jgi:hypothetical protein